MWKRGGSNPFSMISIVIATYWLTVFHFARREAGTITAWTRDEEIRNTMSRGTATMRVRVSPMGRFTQRLRPQRRMAEVLSASGNDLVNAREVDRDECGRVQAQARGDVGAPSGGDQPPRPGRVVPQTRHVPGVAPAHGERRERRRARRGAPSGGPDLLHEKAGARVVFERASTPLAGAHDDDVQPVPGRPARRGAQVDEGGHPHRPCLARREKCPGAVTGREVDGPAADTLERELDG